MIEKKYLSEIKLDLRYKDNRSVLRWCKNNGVGVLSDNGTNKKYVVESEYEVAKIGTAVKYIQQKYGHDKIFTNDNNLNLKRLIEKERENNYTPAGENEKSFMSRLLNKIHEL